MGSNASQREHRELKLKQAVVTFTDILNYESSDKKAKIYFLRARALLNLNEL